MPELALAKRSAQPGRSPSLFRGAALALLFLTAASVAVLLGHVWVRLQVLSLGYQVSEETRIQRELAAAQKRLRTELDMLRAPARIDAIARGRLRMSPPDPSRIRLLRVSGDLLSTADRPVAHVAQPRRVEARVAQPRSVRANAVLPPRPPAVISRAKAE
jgi:cell division protein FtsL